MIRRANPTLPYPLILLCSWCPGWGSNPHVLLRQILSLLRLPIPPPGQQEGNRRGTEGGWQVLIWIPADAVDTALGTFHLLGLR
jgi:hypothetical protein